MIRGLGLKLSQIHMDTHMALFKGTVVFIGPFRGFHVSFRKGREWKAAGRVIVSVWCALLALL